ncbi:probable calcium-binding protein CML49 [Ananas comosus]|uniref:Probable calcium-binding protein CML49 n=1 Tax=Ananas comosus TaxID=4615 RepID=A0A6P5G033_ANACO|nr:probable calcium-binding protein CML49 [Ananas comosus]
MAGYPPGSGYPYGGAAPPYGAAPPHSGGAAPPYGAAPPTYGGAPPTYGGGAPPYGGGAPSAPYGPPGAGEKPPKEGKAQPYYAPYGAAGASPFAALVPSQFPPGTDPNVAACFHAADRDGSGFIDDKELQQALSSYNQSFSLRTVHLLMYLFTGTNVRKIGPKEFISVFYSLQNWRSIFERFDRDRSGKIDASELREALLSLGYAVSPVVLDLLVSKFDKSGGKNNAIEYDNFIECCLTVKGLTDKFKEKDTMCSGTATFTYESFMLTVLPFLIA